MKVITKFLQKNEIQKIFNAIEDSYYFYFVLKQNYLNKGYRYTPKLMTYLFFVHLEGVLERSFELFSVGESNHFSVKTKNLLDAYIYLTSISLKHKFHIFRKLNRKALISENGQLYVEVNTGIASVNGKYVFTKLADKNIHKVLVKVTNSYDDFEFIGLTNDMKIEKLGKTIQLQVEEIE